MNIGTLAVKSSVPTKTIRYYESIDLIPSAKRGANGYRVYDEQDIQTLRFIQRSRSLGFSVSDVADLLTLWRDRARTSSEVKALILKRIEQIDRKVDELESLKRTLVDLAKKCQGDDRPDCPIIDEFAGTVVSSGNSPASRSSASSDSRIASRRA